MRPTTLLVVLMLATIVSTAKAEEKLLLSPGVPPWFATVGKVDLKTKTLVLHIRTVHFVTEEVIKNAVIDGKTTGVQQKIVRPVYETRTREVPLESATIKEAAGKWIKPADLAKRLDVGTAVVVSADSQVIDSTYLKALAKDAIIIVDGSSVQPTAKSELLFPPSVDYQVPRRASNIR